MKRVGPIVTGDPSRTAPVTCISLVIFLTQLNLTWKGTIFGK